MSRIVDNELVDWIKEIGEKYTASWKYKKAPLKPEVGFSLWRDFNDVISMDLKETDGFKILQLINHATRYSAVTIVKSRQKGEIVKASEKLRRTIKKNTRVSAGIIYQPGDIAYYKRNNSDQRKDLEAVLGRENKQNQ